MKTTLKDWRRVYRKLIRVSDLTEDERIRMARCQAATAEERWQMNVNCIRALGLGTPMHSVSDLENRKTRLRELQSPRLWMLSWSDEEMAFGRMYGTDLFNGRSNKPVKRQKKLAARHGFEP